MRPWRSMPSRRGGTMPTSSARYRRPRGGEPRSGTTACAGHSGRAPDGDLGHALCSSTSRRRMIWRIFTTGRSVGIAVIGASGTGRRPLLLLARPDVLLVDVDDEPLQLPQHRSGHSQPTILKKCVVRSVSGVISWFTVKLNLPAPCGSWLRSRRCRRPRSRAGSHRRRAAHTRMSSIRPTGRRFLPSPRRCPAL